MSVDAQAYNITVRRGEFEGEMLYEARVKELPDLVEYGETSHEAYELAVDAIETTAAALAEHNRAMPPPMEPVDDYSGRVTLRIARSLHRALAEAAEAERVSLNQHLVNILTYYSGFAAGRHWDTDNALLWQPVSDKPRTDNAHRRHLRLVHSQDVSTASNWG